MALNNLLWLAIVVLSDISVCSSASDILHLKDEQQEDASSSIEKRSHNTGVSRPLPGYNSHKIHEQPCLTYSILRRLRST